MFILRTVAVVLRPYLLVGVGQRIRGPGCLCCPRISVGGGLSLLCTKGCSLNRIPSSLGIVCTRISLFPCGFLVLEPVSVPPSVRHLLNVTGIIFGCLFVKDNMMFFVLSFGGDIFD